VGKDKNIQEEIINAVGNRAAPEKKGRRKELSKGVSERTKEGGNSKET